MPRRAAPVTGAEVIRGMAGRYLGVGGKVTA